MDIFFIIASILLILLAIYEISVTTLSSQGAGYLTDKVSKGIWQAFLKISNRDGSKNILNYVGVICILFIIGFWILLLLTGFSLMFFASPDSVVDTITEEPAGINEKIYYTGKTLSILGTGDFKPNCDFWRVYSFCVSFSGLVFITMTISYVLPILDADTQQRKLSKSISFLGSDLYDIVGKSWNSSNFINYKLEFSSLSEKILRHSENLESYPILQFFHSSNISESDILNITALDEALNLMLLNDSVTSHDLTLLSLRKSISAYIKTQYAHFNRSATNTPPLPDLNHPTLKGIGIYNNPQNIHNLFLNIDKRRRVLAFLLQNVGWEWQDINNLKFTEEI